ncbi:MAG: polyprenol monophosphomannose synthase [Phycisphaerales bacterium]|nr:polyprenol monophosphomannose synthase [Phycisphaerales bacterium]MCB9864323.1 polyprenol monophosphomannose synthase [Phycisphaerales bacterium]
MPTSLQRGLSVIVPTYREAANLPELLPRIGAALSKIGLPGEIIVVDDDSGDGTANLVESLQLPVGLRLISRFQERGLASAVVRGFEAAAFDTLVCMDADLSHPPESLPAVTRPVLFGESEFCIGSRYVKGGRTLDDWGLLRRLNSKAATLLAWPLTTARDPMAGFFCLTRALFDRAVNSGVNAIGYKIGLELAVRGGCRRVAEVGITFGDRQHGQSKLTVRQQLLYLRQLVSLYEFALRGSLRRRDRIRTRSQQLFGKDVNAARSHRLM